MTEIDRIEQPWGTRTPFGPGDRWPTRVDTYLTPGVTADQVDRWVRTASVLHSGGDAMDVAVRGGRIVGVRGRADDRVNHGRLGPKDLFGWQAVPAADRLTVPLMRQGGRVIETDWDTALDRIAGKVRELLAEHGPDAIGFYTTGQLFLEEYYALAVFARAGIGTNHLDGNTRLCTATAAASLKASFGCDGQPGSFADLDHADVIALYGHNMAESQTVLWSRVLDRLAGPRPPAVICVDPRQTPVARAATVHLAPRPGTNLMLMNALLHEIVRNDWVDHDYLDRHTGGFAELRATVATANPTEAARVCDVPADDLVAAARLIGRAERLVSTVLQGFYQSHQATAAAVQVNNIHLIRGMLGRPGAGVLQMNGQPSAENARECGANGDLPGFRNWANDDHIRDLAAVWNVDPQRLTHHAPPTHLMKMIRLAETGTLKMLHVSGTNPAVSLPELRRVRGILGRDDLFLVVQDIFPTETTELADIVLPAATWGEKTGTLTNADRTVHLCEKAVEPPGLARPDLDIVLDLAERLDLRDRDGAPLLPWRTPADTFEAWTRCSAGRPCDHTGLDHDRLRSRGGMQWPCTPENSDGTERLYTDGTFPSDPHTCESYGHDLETGEPTSRADHERHNPAGRAMIKSAAYLPPPEATSERFPYLLTTGRTLYHFHTRTKTARAPQLQRAAPRVWLEMSATDATRHGWSEGDLVRVSTARGHVHARLRITVIRPGTVFLPFHYGHWDRPRPTDDDATAANELTRTEWDPVSKQPLFKLAAARIDLVRRSDGTPSDAPTTAAARPVGGAVPPTVGGPRATVTEQIDDTLSTVAGDRRHRPAD